MKCPAFVIALLCPVLVAAETALPSRGICAHRGAMDAYPENTIEAFQEAVRLKVQMIELDVRMTKDGTLVVLHDDSVDRTTNGTGKIERLTWDQVRKLDAGSWKSPAFADARIPKFEDVLDLLPRDIWLNIHLKGDALLGARTAHVIVSKSRQHQAFLACGKSAAEGARQVSNKVLICNMERGSNNQEYVEQTINNGDDFIQFFKTPIDPELERFVALLKAHDIKVNFCCADDPRDIQTLFEYGVDFVLVNKTGSAMRTFESLERGP